MAAEHLLQRQAEAVAARMAMPKLLLSTREAAAALSICPKTLYAHTAPRGLIPSVRIGSRVLYSVADLQAFIAAEGGHHE